MYESGCVQFYTVCVQFFVCVHISVHVTGGFAKDPLIYYSIWAPAPESRCTNQGTKFSTKFSTRVVTRVYMYCPFAYKWDVYFVDPFSPNLHTEGNFQARFSQRKSIEFTELYRFTSSFFALRKYFDV
jgi:hypothetical protein